MTRRFFKLTGMLTVLLFLHVAAIPDMDSVGYPPDDGTAYFQFELNDGPEMDGFYADLSKVSFARYESGAKNVFLVDQKVIGSRQQRGYRRARDGLSC